MANEIKNKNTNKISEKAQLVLDVLKEHSEGKGMTLAEINDYTGEVEVRAGTISGLVKKGLVVPVGEREVEKIVHRNVTVYEFKTADELQNADGKTYNYNDNQKAILNALNAREVKNFTISGLTAELADVAKVSSGVITALVKRGNIVKSDAVEKVDGKAKSTVNVYDVAVADAE